MKNGMKKESGRKQEQNLKQFCMKNGSYLNVDEIHGKGMNFLGNTFKV